MAISRQLTAALKQYGFLNLLNLSFSKLGEKLGYYRDTYTLFERDLIALEPGKPLATGYEYRELSVEGLKTISAPWLTEAQLGAFANRLEKPGYFGLGIFREGTTELVYYFWVNFEKIEMPDHLDAFHNLQLSQEEAYLYDGYCHPDHRGKGFHGFAALYLMQLAAKAGKKKMITIIRSINKAAIASQLKVGFRAVREIRFTGFQSRISCTLRNL
jgi:hypothetical protein